MSARPHHRIRIRIRTEAQPDVQLLLCFTFYRSLSICFCSFLLLSASTKASLTSLHATVNAFKSIILEQNRCTASNWNNVWIQSTFLYWNKDLMSGTVSWLKYPDRDPCASLPAMFPSSEQGTVESPVVSVRYLTACKPASPSRFG